MQSVEVEIFGRRFRLRSDDPERTKQIANEINDQIDALSKHYDNLDFTKLLLLICLQQQDEVLTLDAKNRALSSELERLNQMLSKNADIVISAVGKKHLVTAYMVRPDSLIIDVGINVETHDTGKKLF